MSTIATLIPPQLAPSWNHTAQTIASEAEVIISDSKLVNDSVASVAIESVSVENSLGPFAKFRNEREFHVSRLNFYASVSPNKELRDVASALNEKVENFLIEENLREDLYKVFVKLDEITKNSKDLDPETRRYIEKTKLDFERSGLALPQEKREKMKELQQRLSTLAIKFAKNSGEQTEYLLFTREELDGVPEAVLEQFSTVIDDSGVEKLKMTFKYPDILPTLKYAKNAETRKAAFLGDQNKVPANVDILAEATKLRAELAATLGYPTFADYVLEERMAKTSKAVLEFLDDLKTKLMPLGLKDKEKLVALKKEDLESRGLPSDDNELYVWDSSFYQNLMLEKEYQIDSQKISEYFPMQSTVEKMLQIFEELFNLKFVEYDSSSELYSTWHEDVKQFAVWKLDDPANPEFRGWLYFDLFPREGKFGHAANFTIEPGYTKADGSKRYTVTALVCNFSKPTASKPSLLKHDEVKTFFHELGHGIHNLIGTAKYARFSGTSVSWDFVECPSKLLEYWTWSPQELKRLSSHYEHPEQQLPDELIDSLNRSKNVNAGVFNLRQLFFAVFDMTLHGSKTGDVDLTKEWNDLRETLSLTSNGDTVSKGYASFGHMMGGYAAGYYGYAWSAVFAADIYFSKFKDDPMNRENGIAYRDTILAPGGSRENMDTLVEFLGREPNSEAYMQELGVN